jgi:hypothetical protein
MFWRFTGKVLWSSTFCHGIANQESKDRRYTEDSNLHTHRRENLKSYLDAIPFTSLTNLHIPRLS